MTNAKASSSRSIIYRADLDGLRALTLFLIKDCCADSAELCAPLIAKLTPCCREDAPWPSTS